MFKVNEEIIMALTEKNRKIVWGKSGNRCAICKKEIVMEATAIDSESIAGDECHIVSKKNEWSTF